MGILVLRVEGERDADVCAKVDRDFQECQEKVYKHYRRETAHNPNEHEKPDLIERKICNFMTTTSYGCADKLVGACYTKDDVTQFKDEEIKKKLALIQSSQKTWDSSKCPATKDYFNRMKITEVAMNEEQTEEQTDGATKTKSLIFFLILFVIILAST